MHRNKRIWVWVFVFFCLFGGLSIFLRTEAPSVVDPFEDVASRAPALSDVDHTMPLSSQKLAFSVGEKRFSVPKMFIETPESVLDGKGVNLIAVMPDYVSPIALSKEAYLSAVGDGRVIRILVESSSSKNPLAAMIEHRQRHQMMATEEVEAYGLQKFASDKEAIPQDTYVQRGEGGEVEAYILCTTKTVKPLCQHHFFEDGLAYSISYDAVNLQFWRKIQSDAVQFVKSFQAL